MTVEEAQVPVNADTFMGPAFFQNPLPMTITHGDTERFLAVNQAFVTLTGFYRADAIGATSRELNLWADRSDRERITGKLRDSGNEVVGPLSGDLRTRSGDVITCRYAFRLLSTDGAECVLTVIIPGMW